ncbi:hypothetical protein FS749_003287, partial [Ceratobasidium sp. UAMH 11750]
VGDVLALATSTTDQIKPPDLPDLPHIWPPPHTSSPHGTPTSLTTLPPTTRPPTLAQPITVPTRVLSYSRPPSVACSLVFSPCHDVHNISISDTALVALPTISQAKQSSLHQVSPPVSSLASDEALLCHFPPQMAAASKRTH